MGRRSTNTTKSGKYMNPTDRARKEARRKELKKNKKQRMAVRQAVLKSKDAQILLEEATLYDQQEYDPKSTTTLSERVLQEKRKKLMETYDRMIVLYRKEDPDKASELQVMRTDYDKKRNEMIQYYEQVKLTEKVNATEIPLPEIPPQNLTGLPQYPGDIPLPPGLHIPHPAVLAAASMTTATINKVVPSRSILKKAETVNCIPGPPPGLPTLHKKPCPPPPGTPDELSDFDSSTDDDSHSELASSDGEDLDEDDEKVEGRSRKIRFADDNTNGDYNDEANESNALRSSNVQHHQLPLPYPRPNLPMGMAGQLPLMPPPPFLHPGNIPVPSGMPPPIPMVGAPGLHPNPSSIAMPPQMFAQSNKINRPVPPQKKLADIPLPQVGTKPKSGGTTIEAKPQLKNLIGDSTKLVPTSLLSRKVKPTNYRTGIKTGLTGHKSTEIHHRVRYGDGGASKDDAYDQFMKEMEEFL